MIVCMIRVGKMSYGLNKILRICPVKIKSGLGYKSSQVRVQVQQSPVQVQVLSVQAQVQVQVQQKWTYVRTRVQVWTRVQGKTTVLHWRFNYIKGGTCTFSFCDSDDGDVTSTKSTVNVNRSRGRSVMHQLVLSV